MSCQISAFIQIIFRYTFQIQHFVVVVLFGAFLAILFIYLFFVAVIIADCYALNAVFISFTISHTLFNFNQYFLLFSL